MYDQNCFINFWWISACLFSIYKNKTYKISSSHDVWLHAHRQTRNDWTMRLSDRIEALNTKQINNSTNWKLMYQHNCRHQNTSITKWTRIPIKCSQKCTNSSRMWKWKGSLLYFYFCSAPAQHRAAAAPINRTKSFHYIV